MGWKKTKEEALAVQTPQQVAPVQVEEREAVVTELPTVQLRKIKGEDGIIYNLSTLSEAMQEIREGIREILKRTAE